MRHIALTTLAAAAVLCGARHADAAYTQTLAIAGQPYPLSDMGCWTEVNGVVNLAPGLSCMSGYHAWLLPMAVTYSPANQTLTTYASTYLGNASDQACFCGVAVNEKGLATAYTPNVCVTAVMPATNPIGSLTVPSGGAAFMNFYASNGFGFGSTSVSFVSARWGS
jgi:hypothetical protein